MPRWLYTKALCKVPILFIEASNDHTFGNGRAKPFNFNIDRLKVSEFDIQTCVNVRKYGINHLICFNFFFIKHIYYRCLTFVEALIYPVNCNLTQCGVNYQLHRCTYMLYFSLQIWNFICIRCILWIKWKCIPFFF